MSRYPGASTGARETRLAWFVLRVVSVTSPAVVPRTTRRRYDDTIDVVAELAAALTSPGAAQRFVITVPRLVPCGSVVLLRLAGESLLPVAAFGLVPELMSQRFVIAAHPRFAQILRRHGVVRFVESALADPFDGLLSSGEPLGRVHACMGIALRVDGAPIGALAFDALDPGAFDDVDDRVIELLAALAAAAMRAASLVDAVDRQAAQPAAPVPEERAPQLVAASEAMRVVCREAELAAQSDLTVLITGETGTGKEVVARAIHRGGPRAQRPLVYVNCAALPEPLAESELFGHVRGSFTGAIDHRAGKFEAADHGTLFLDEIGELPLTIQAKLLRALQTGEIQRVGADHVVRVDARVIAATNRDLIAEVAAGRFRADLYHRLSVYPIALPPLRDRRDDILRFAGVFLDDARARLALGALRLTPAARAALVAHDWPGNVRELEHTILRAALRAAGGRRGDVVVIDRDALELVARPLPMVLLDGVVSDPATTLDEAIAELKRRRIAEAVAQSRGNWSQAARRLGLDRGNLHRMAKRLGIRI